MNLHTFKATSVLKETGMRVESEVRGFKAVADEPKNLGGTDTGMSPVETLLCAVGACQCMTARFFAKSLKVDLEEYRVDVEGDLNIMGFLKGDSGIRPGFQGIRVTVHVKSKAPQEKITELLTTVESRCPVGETVLNGTPVVVRHIVENS
ncbi:MAG: OsmC family protein [Smithellaceae bacterium]|nr:OsmC family protein [Smithellaceae bacterium]